MITRHDLETAIAECQGKRNPDARTCIMLAAFYTIRREMFEEEKEVEHYSYAPAPVRNIVEIVPRYPTRMLPMPILSLT